MQNIRKRKRNRTLLCESKEGRKKKYLKHARALRSREENIKIIIGDAYYCPGLGRESPVRTGGKKLLLELPDVALLEVGALDRSCRECAVRYIRDVLVHCLEDEHIHCEGPLMAYLRRRTSTILARSHGPCCLQCAERQPTRCHELGIDGDMDDKNNKMTLLFIALKFLWDLGSSRGSAGCLSRGLFEIPQNSQTIEVSRGGGGIRKMGRVYDSG
ncbi:hypothetical protein BKA61DRAFT_15489 [Leptodontidium sp. MPI-SDFR-AT-0119]|nr:hypothetical protein BKA61DRAFT_15489 [Leptodontidium sp. MPI-SDFR-AT-0119]